MIQIQETDNTQPICPHCEKEIRTLLANRLSTFMGKGYVYFCEHCKKTIGVANRKGFWMG